MNQICLNYLQDVVASKNLIRVEQYVLGREKASSAPASNYCSNEQTQESEMHKQILWDQCTEHIFKSKERGSVIAVKL